MAETAAAAMATAALVKVPLLGSSERKPGSSMPEAAAVEKAAIPTLPVLALTAVRAAVEMVAKTMAFLPLTERPTPAAAVAAV